jgi:hypothetical protein
MKRGLVFALILVTSTLLGGFAQDAQSLQNSSNIKGAELLQMLRSGSGAEIDRASSLIGNIYGPRLNNGIIPDHETLYGLGRILMAYLTDHPESHGQPIDQLVMEVLKNAPAQIEETKAFWISAHKAAEAFFSQPSPENAELFYKALPDKRMPDLDFQGYVRLSGFVFDFASNFSILEKEMAERGEPHAVDVGFRLINISDGAAGELLVHALGEIVLKHPRLFLQKVLAHQGKTEPTVFYLLGGILNPVAWWEMPEDDKGEAKYKELYDSERAARIKALETVSDPDLKAIRDRCIEILRKSGVPGHNMAINTMARNSKQLYLSNLDD